MKNNEYRNRNIQGNMKINIFSRGEGNQKKRKKKMEKNFTGNKETKNERKKCN